MQTKSGGMMHSARWYDSSYKLILLLFDLIIIDVLFYFSYVLRMGWGMALPEYYVTLLVVFNLAWIAAAMYNDIYDIDGHTKYSEIIVKLIFAFGIHLFFILAFIVSTKGHTVSRQFLTTTYAGSLLFICAFRISSIRLYKYYKNLRQNFKKVIIIGAQQSSQALYNFFTGRKDLGYKFVGFFDDQPDYNTFSRDLVLGGVQDLKEFCKKNEIDEIYYTLPITQSELIKDISEFADRNFISFKIAPDFRGILHTNVNLYYYDTIPVLAIRREPLSILVNQIIKRSFDIFFSLAVILFIFPILLPLVALAIKLESKGPVFFKQLRSGAKNRQFVCYKFRTMTVNGEADSKQASKNDARITRVGKFLRKTSLDEFPQFINVLLGDMSVVGPRPHMLKHTEVYSGLIKRFMIRHFVSPGITGYAQVNGYRGETKNLDLMKKRVEYDVFYMENWSLLLDLKIIIRTIINIFKGEKYAY